MVTPSGELGVVEEIKIGYDALTGGTLIACVVRVPALADPKSFHPPYALATFDANKLKRALTAEQVLGDDYFA